MEPMARIELATLALRKRLSQNSKCSESLDFEALSAAVRLKIAEILAESFQSFANLYEFACFHYASDAGSSAASEIDADHKTDRNCGGRKMPPP